MPSRPSLSTFRSQFPCEALGICQSDPQVATWANDSTQRLMMDPLTPESGWWGTWARMHFNATIMNGHVYVTTPREVAAIGDIAVCGHPIHLRNSFYEFLTFTKGVQPKQCHGLGCGSAFQAFERDNVVTFAPLLPTPQKIRIYPTDNRDFGLRVLLQGKDQNKQVILTTDPGSGLSAPGEYVQIASPFVDSVNLYSSIDGLMKDQTYGPLQLFQVDPTTNAEAPLSTMDPNESAASYRQYLVNGIPNLNLCCTSPGIAQITAEVRLDFVPVQNETDYLSLPNVPALVEESLSIYQSRIFTGNAVQQSASHHARAIALLNGQLDLYTGKNNVAINLPIFGSNRLRPSFA